MSFILRNILKDETKWYIFPLIPGSTFIYFVGDFSTKHSCFMVALALIFGTILYSIAAIIIYEGILTAAFCLDWIGEYAVAKIIKIPDPRNFSHRILHLFITASIFPFVFYIMVLSYSDSDCTAFYRGTCV